MRIKKNTTGGAVTVDNDTLFSTKEGLIYNPSDYQLDPRISISNDFDIVISDMESSGVVFRPMPYKVQVPLIYGNDEFTIGSSGEYYAYEDTLNLIRDNFDGVGDIVFYAPLNVGEANIKMDYKVFKSGSGWPKELEENGMKSIAIYCFRLAVDSDYKVDYPNCRAYKFYRGSMTDLESQINNGDLIPEIPPQIELSTITHVSTNTGKKTVIRAWRGVGTDYKILQDFDLEIEVNDKITIKPNGLDFIEVPVKINTGEIKYLNIPSQIFRNLHGAASVGNVVHWHMKGKIFDTIQGVKFDAGHNFNQDGSVFDLYPSSHMGSQWVFTVQAVKPNLGSNYNSNQIDILKHWKNALAPTEERIKTPKDFRSMNVFPHDWKLTEDFNLTCKTSGESLWLQVNHRKNYTKKFIPINTYYGDKLLMIGEAYLNAPAVAKDTEFYFVVTAEIHDSYTVNKDFAWTLRDGATDYLEVDENTLIDRQKPIAQIKVIKLASNEFDLNSVEIIEHWKGSLKAGYYTDNETICIDTENHLYVPEHYNPLSDGAILQDFDFNIEKLDGKDAIKLNLSSGEDGIKFIPVRTSIGTRYVGVGNPTFDLSVLGSLQCGKYYRWTIAFKIQDDNTTPVNGWVTYTGSGYTFDQRVKEDPSTATNIALLSVVVKVPLVAGTLTKNDFKIYKFWKNALAPAEERIVIPEASSYILDESTIFEATLGEENKIFAPALLQPHPVNYRILEDFDFNYSVGKTFTGAKPYLRISPVGGSRYIPVMVEGIRKYMYVAEEDVIFPDLFGGGYGGSWKYFTLMAVIYNTESGGVGLGTEYENGGIASYVDPYPDGTQFRFAQIGVKFNIDNETLDFKNVKVFKYWKNALAPFDELMQNYKERNP